MLGLGIDAVRFYEKKGLVHPAVNLDNRYRMYSMYQIMELLDVSYYRSLGMSIGQISKIYQGSDEKQLTDLLEEKRQETQKTIRYQQQILKRIEHVESLVKRIRQQAQEIDVTFFPESDILFEQREDNMAQYLEQVSRMDYDQYVFCQLAREYAVKSESNGELSLGTPLRTMLLMDSKITKRLGGKSEKSRKIFGTKALHSVVRLSNADLQGGEIEQMLLYAKQHHLTVKHELLMIEIPMVSYTDLEDYYAELFLPVVDEKPSDKEEGENGDK